MGTLLDNLRKKHAATQPQTRRHAVNFLAHRDEIAEAMLEQYVDQGLSYDADEARL